MSNERIRHTRLHPKIGTDTGRKEEVTTFPGEHGQAAAEGVEAGSFDWREHVLETVTNQSAVIAMVRDRLAAYVAESQKLRGANRNQTKPIVGSICTLEKVEDELDALVIDLTSSDELYEVAREMAKDTKK